MQKSVPFTTPDHFATPHQPPVSKIMNKKANNPVDASLVDAPLVVDLDGTLLRSDLLVESAFVLLKSNFLHFFKVLLGLFSGKAAFKGVIAGVADIEVSNLPYNDEVIRFIQQQRHCGRKIILATASHIRYARQVSDHLGLFDEVFATQGGVNLSAGRKKQRLVEAFGEKGFDYMGNAKDDLHVWGSARSAFIVNPERGVLSRVQKLGNVERVFDNKQGSFWVWIRQLRLYQWVKNLLIFVPLVSSHQMLDAKLLVSGVIAFIVFGLCASSAYLLNDLLDLEDDRYHHSKRNRPLASGAIPVLNGIIMVPVLLMLSFGSSIVLLPISFVFSLAVYFLVTVAYSLYFKHKMMVDVIILAALYTLRIIAGNFAFGLELTFWLLAFSNFIFLSLAFVKRCTELIKVRITRIDGKSRGRDYYPSDLEIIAAMGVASGFISVLVLALYIQEQATVTLYSNPQLIWLACPLLLFWIGRIWLLTQRGLMHDDPIVFAIKDPTSLFIGLLFGLTFWISA